MVQSSRSVFYAFEPFERYAYKISYIRVDSENCATIDLHGASVSEAVQITKTILIESPATQAKPLKIITGRGIHSANGIGVLGPAVKNALVEDGWDVGRWSGGLVVRGKSRR